MVQRLLPGAQIVGPDAVTRWRWQLPTPIIWRRTGA